MGIFDMLKKVRILAALSSILSDPVGKCCFPSLLCCSFTLRVEAGEVPSNESKRQIAVAISP